MNNQINEADEELRKQSNGDKYFILYANETKMKTFKTIKSAKKFQRSLNE